MDPAQIPTIVHSMLQIASGIEAQTAGLNPATTAALKNHAKDLRTLANRLSPPKEDAGQPSQAKPAQTGK